MRILILGGTVFLGRHLTEAALEQGHEVRSKPELNNGLNADKESQVLKDCSST